jgi:hypothetical protein
MAVRKQIVGPGMLAACEYLLVAPHASKSEVAVAVGPHGSRFYGWQIVQRAIHAGLIAEKSGVFGGRVCVRLRLTAKGRKALSQHAKGRVL